MSKLVTCLMLAALVALPLTVWAEDEVPAAEAKEAPVAKRTVDPAAMKLLDAAKAKLFSNRDAGLKDLSCKVTMKNPMMPGDVVCTVTYEAPDKSDVKLVSLPPDMEPMRAMIEPQLKPQIENLVLQFYKNEPFKDLEKFNIAMKEGSEDTIVLTAFAKDADTKRREVLFGEDGLPKRMIEAGATGEVEVNVTYKPADDKFLMAAVSLQTPNGPVGIKFEHEKSGKFWLVTKEVVSVEMMGMEITYLITDYKVNTKAATPAETPEAPKPPAEKPADGD
jgi:hypothetical protein